jgi:hypothetical protein
MCYAILLRQDEQGQRPVLVHQHDTLPSGPGVRWRFVAQTEDREEAVRTVELLQGRYGVRGPALGPHAGDPGA